MSTLKYNVGLLETPKALNCVLSIMLAHVKLSELIHKTLCKKFICTGSMVNTVSS